MLQTLKLHFLNSHIDVFAKQSTLESDEQREHFHQVTMTFEKRSKEKKIDAMLADGCWWSHQVHSFKNQSSTANEQKEGEVILSDLSDDECTDDDDLPPEPKRTRASTSMDNFQKISQTFSIK